jgi:hypothetical protein
MSIRYKEERKERKERKEERQKGWCKLRINTPAAAPEALH